MEEGRHYDVVIVGAGISGISAAYHLKKLCPKLTFTMFEGRSNIGGIKVEVKKTKVSWRTMGCIPSKAEGSTVVSAGRDTLRACFAVCLQLDVYQPHYANIAIQYEVFNPQHMGTHHNRYSNKYGEGTVFEGMNGMGRKEQIKIVELIPNQLIVMKSLTVDHCLYQYIPDNCCTWQNLGGIKIVYTFSDPAPNGAVTMSFSMVGPNMNLFRNHVNMQLNTMKKFIMANVEAICNDAPQDLVVVPELAQSRQAAGMMFQASGYTAVARAAQRAVHYR